jgi:hypothetical protein
MELARQIREVWAENPGITAEELAYRIKDRVKLKRLTARVRRVMLEALPRLDQVPFAPALGACAEAESPPRQYRVGQEGSVCRRARMIVVDSLPTDSSLATDESGALRVMHPRLTSGVPL